jgi:hypothetical protein
MLVSRHLGNRQWISKLTGTQYYGALVVDMKFLQRNEMDTSGALMKRVERRNGQRYFQSTNYYALT